MRLYQKLKIKNKLVMIVIYNNIIPVSGYIAMNLFGIIFARKKLKDKSEFYKSVIFRHETIHTIQYLETLFVGFLLIYGLEYIVKLIITKSTSRAYKSISLEQDAYQYEKDEQYKKHRPLYNWVKYIFKVL